MTADDTNGLSDQEAIDQAEIAAGIFLVDGVKRQLPGFPAYVHPHKDTSDHCWDSVRYALAAIERKHELECDKVSDALVPKERWITKSDTVGPTHPLRCLTDAEILQHYHAVSSPYIAFEEYQRDPGSAVTGRFWTAAQLDLAQSFGWDGERPDHIKLPKAKKFKRTTVHARLDEYRQAQADHLDAKRDPNEMMLVRDELSLPSDREREYALAQHGERIFQMKNREQRQLAASLPKPAISGLYTVARHPRD